MILRTALALLTNFNGSYISLPFIALFTVIALSVPSGRFPPYNLLMSCGFVAATVIGLLAGTTLTEIKVKPLSYVLPGQEKSMPPAVLLVGALLCLAYALLLLGRPMTVVSVPAWQQALAAFCFGLGLFSLVVAACVVTHDTAFTSMASMVPFLVFTGALAGNEELWSVWVSVSGAVAENVFVAALFGGCGVVTVFRVLGDRTRSRDLCGAPFMPLKAYDNPLKMDDYARRMRSGAFRPSVMTDSRASPGGLVMAALSRRVVGTSWDYLVLDTRAGATRWQFTYKLVSLLVMLTVLGLYFPLGRSFNPLLALFSGVVFTFMWFPPTFRARLSPMPPVSRRRHFRSFLAKGVSVYVLTILVILLLWLAMQVVSEMAIGSGSAGLTATRSLPLRGIVIVGATVPIMCWAFAKLRSAIGFVVFLVVFLTAVSVVVNAAQEFLLAQSYPTLLLATAVCWLPFVLIARKRCLKDDLLLL
jgi:hypothetical protein